MLAIFSECVPQRRSFYHLSGVIISKSRLYKFIKVSRRLAGEIILGYGAFGELSILFNRKHDNALAFLYLSFR